MGRRGPIPKPGKTVCSSAETGAPTCPSWLTPAARKEWKRIAPELSRMGLLTALDQSLLAGYCCSYVLWQQAQEMLSVQGTVYLTPKGRLQTRPEVAVAKTCAEMMQTFAAELGLTPGARARMIDTKAEPGDSPIEELLRDLRGGK